ncbi:DUF397 domain-containing protein [Streptomyces sp. ODS28]|uniref:DUF397 domain-containing protein n=1 Tax=Streptomyces sp. ODS28 TaxID=3136688 RepID=UPI0031ED5490
MCSKSDLSQPHWRKSSYSGGQGGECLEVIRAGARIAVRDSKNTQGPVLAFPAAAFGAFAAAAGKGVFGAR